jgi:hypothetical protein
MAAANRALDDDPVYRRGGCDAFWWESVSAYDAALMTGKYPKQAASFRQMLA